MSDSNSDDLIENLKEALNKCIPWNNKPLVIIEGDKSMLVDEKVSK